MSVTCSMDSGKANYWPFCIKTCYFVVLFRHIRHGMLMAVLRKHCAMVFLDRVWLDFLAGQPQKLISFISIVSVTNPHFLRPREQRRIETFYRDNFRVRASLCRQKMSDLENVLTVASAKRRFLLLMEEENEGWVGNSRFNHLDSSRLWRRYPSAGPAVRSPNFWQHQCQLTVLYSLSQFDSH
jgi:hypothetical protein